ncbi:hypothetical protein WJX77_004806 [Trebouxia sp. C0004]
MGLASKLSQYQQQGGAQGGAPAGYPQQGLQPGMQGQQPGQQGQAGTPGQSGYAGAQGPMGGSMPGQQGFGQQGNQGTSSLGQGQPGQQYGQQPQGQQYGQQLQGQQYGQQLQGQQYGQQAGQFGGPGQQGGPQGQFSGPALGGAPGQQGQFGAPPQGQFGGSQGQFGGPPQGQSGGGQGQFGGGGGNPAVQQGLMSKLQQIIQSNRLEAFYPPPKLQQLVNRLQQLDFRSLAAKYNMPMELAYSLATLALYDIIIYADDSGSMAFEEGGERIQDLKLMVGRVADVATLFDDDGILVRFMNGTTEGNGIRDSMSAGQLISQVNFNGMTPLGTNLNQKIIQPFLMGGINSRNLQKPILVIIITDGEPTGEPRSTVAQVIKNAKNMSMNSPYGPGAIAFEFAQVGKDQAAQAFLGQLDKDPEVGRMIDATSYYELEAEEYKRKGVMLTPDLWLIKLMVGAVDQSFDEQD